MKPRKRNVVEDIFGNRVRRATINGKQKGNKNERDCAKMLERWTGVPFTRTPSSGGLRLKNAPNFCGDVVCAEASFYFPFAIETKHLKNFQVVLLKSGELRERSQVKTIWAQCQRDATRAKKQGMCLLRTNNMASGTYVVVMRHVPALARRLGEDQWNAPGDGLMVFESPWLFAIGYETFIRLAGVK